MRLLLRSIVLAAVAATSAVMCPAQQAPVPDVIAYSGYASNKSGAYTGTHNLVVRIFDAAVSGNKLFEQSFPKASFNNGSFSVLIGIGTPAPTLPLNESVFSNGAFVEIAIDGTTLSPRQLVTTTPYAYKADTVQDGSIGNMQLTSDASSLLKVSGGSLSTKAGNLSMNGEQYLGVNTDSTFKYSGRTMGTYSLGWIGDPWNPGGWTAWLSSYAGIKLFTASSPRLAITQNGMVGIGTVTPATILDVNGAATIRGSTAVQGPMMVSGRLSLVTGDGGIDTAAESHFSAGSYSDPAPGMAYSVKVSQGLAADTISVGTIQINGGADVAEPFRILAARGVLPKPGMVAVIDPCGTGDLRVSTHPYDHTVGGIISGAHGINPGLVLRQRGTIVDGSLPVASSGRVWCWCDSDAAGSISPGDLLTTSGTPGHAMRAANYTRAHGAILGKAMTSLKKGRGLVLVLVTLQ